MSKTTTTRRPKLHPHIEQYAKFLKVSTEKVLQIVRGKCRDTSLLAGFRAIRRVQSNRVSLRQLIAVAPAPNHEKTSRKSRTRA